MGYGWGQIRPLRSLRRFEARNMFDDEEKFSFQQHCVFNTSVLSIPLKPKAVTNVLSFSNELEMLKKAENFHRFD